MKHDAALTKPRWFRLVGREQAKVAAIVKGPPSYLTAEEALGQLFPESNKPPLIVRIERNNPYRKRERMHAIIDYRIWGDVSFVETVSDDHHLPSLVKRCPRIVQPICEAFLLWKRANRDRRVLNRIARKHGRTESVMCGHTAVEIHLAAKMNPRRCVILDSGSTIRKLEHAGTLPAVSGRKKLILFSAGFRKVRHDRMQLFTTSSSTGDIRMPTIENTLAVKKSNVAGKKSGNEVIIVGPVPSIVRNRNATEVIHEALKCIGASMDHLTYVPHPGGRESEDFLSRLQAETGCRIDDRLLPVEVKVTRSAMKPLAIIGFSSTSLKHFATLFGDSVMVANVWSDDWAAEEPWRLAYRREVRDVTALKEIDLSHLAQRPHA